MAYCQIRCRIKWIDYIGNLDLNNLKKSGSFKDINPNFLADFPEGPDIGFDESDRFQILEKFGNNPEVTKDLQNASSVDLQTFQADWTFLKCFSQLILSYFS